MTLNMQQAVRAELAKILLGGAEQGRKDAFAGAPSGVYNTGPGGSFLLPGVNRDFISAVIQPQGLWAALPAHPSMYANPEFGYITGFTPVTGSQPNDACGDGPQPGSVVTCIQTAHFGRYRMDTKPLEINRLGLLNNRADPLDFQLINGPLFPMLGGVTPGGAGGSYASDIFNPKRELASRMGNVARAYNELLSQQLWFGVPKATSDATSAGSDEFPGLDLLISTTKIDARTGTPCNALASDIKDFGYRDVGLNGGADLFNALYYIVQTRKFVAKRTNMGAVVWKFVMREALFNEIAKVWPCIMATYGCFPNGVNGVEGGITPVISLDNQAQLRQDMLDNQYLPVGGQRFEVIIDDALAEEDRGGACLASDIVFLPFTVKGGYEVLFREYQDYQGGAAIGQLPGNYGNGTFMTDNGQFLWWTKPNNNVCIQMGSKTEQRVILLTPHLAGRLNSVQYCPLQHSPDPFAGQLYNSVTGESNRGTLPALYSDWNTDGPGVH